MVCEHTDPWRGPEGVPTVTQFTRDCVRSQSSRPENLAN